MSHTNQPILSPDEALSIILEHTTILDHESVPLVDASGRRLSADVISDINVPPHDNSAMDGYALVAKSTTGATRTTPARLTVTGEIRAGGDPSPVLADSRSCIRIMTGAPIPGGADAVVQVEDTGESGSTVSVFREVGTGENVRRAGEDIRQGAAVLARGERLGSGEIGLLASLNHVMVPVFRQPRVAIISTGDEIAEVGGALSHGQIRNSNAYSVAAEARKYGALPSYIGIARDTMEDTRQKLSSALGHDIIITSGGISMGKYDYVGASMMELGVEIMIQTIRMKPGKPCVFGVRDSTLFFGLPGNPVSSIVSFIQFVRPAILKMTGASKLSKPVLNAILHEDIQKKAGRVHYLRGRFFIENGVIHVTTTGPQGSGILRSMKDANCLIILPEESSGARRGDIVSVQLIHHEEI
jgi:molybdopterin molybdotransferase